MSKAQRESAQSTSTAGDRPFNTPEQNEMIAKQIKAFFAHTNNDAVLRELETVLKAGRDNIGWKHTGRLLIEAFKGHAFES